MTIKEWIETQFTPESRPAGCTVRRWLEQGEITGRKFGGTWYVEHVEKPSTNPLVQRVRDKEAALRNPEVVRLLKKTFG